VSEAAIGTVIFAELRCRLNDPFSVSNHEYSEAMMRDKTDRRTMEMFPRRGRPPKERVLSDAERARRYRKKLTRNEQVRVTVTIPADRRDDLLAFVATLQATS
jgi:hypothetical protein